MTRVALKNRKVILSSLEQFGFFDMGEEYVYYAMLAAGSFRMELHVNRKGEVSSAVFDRETDEEYYLHNVASAEGETVGKIREDYGKVLKAFTNHCTESDVFKSKQFDEVLDHIRTEYGSRLEFLWEKFPEDAIVRRKDNKKWYGLFGILSGNKIGLPADEKFEVLIIRGEPAEIASAVDGKNYFPGYHMNKTHWYTIILDGRVHTEAVLKRIDKSYEIAGAAS